MSSVFQVFATCFFKRGQVNSLLPMVIFLERCKGMTDELTMDLVQRMRSIESIQSIILCGFSIRVR